MEALTLCTGEKGWIWKTIIIIFVWLQWQFSECKSDEQHRPGNLRPGRGRGGHRGTCWRRWRRSSWRRRRSCQEHWQDSPQGPLSAPSARAETTGKSEMETGINGINRNISHILTCTENIERGLTKYVSIFSASYSFILNHEIWSGPSVFKIMKRGREIYIKCR